MSRKFPPAYSKELKHIVVGKDEYNAVIVKLIWLQREKLQLQYI
jgi:hypothetical protein